MVKTKQHITHILCRTLLLLLFVAGAPLSAAANPATHSKSTDVTNKVGVGVSDWKRGDGSNSALVGWAGSQMPTADGRTAALAEVYSDPNNLPAAGKKIYQTVSGLADGTYTVVLYAVAYDTDTGESAYSDGVEGTEVGYVYANGVHAAIKAHHATFFGDHPGEYVLENVQVTGGQLELGLATTSTGTNWHAIQIKSLTYQAESDMYVIFSGSNYLGNPNVQGNKEYGTTEFNPSSCVWTGNSGGTFRNGNGTFIYMNGNTVVSSKSATCEIIGTENGNIGAMLKANGKYLKYTGTTWERATNETEKSTTVVFGVTYNDIPEQFTAPLINGDYTFTDIGQKTYTHTDASYRKRYADYIFYNDTHHYYDIDGKASISGVPTAETFTYSWSISTGAIGHVSIDQNTGVVDYHTAYAQDGDGENVSLYITLTATSNVTGKVYSVSRNVNFKKLSVSYTVSSNMAGGGVIYNASNYVNGEKILPDGFDKDGLSVIGIEGFRGMVTVNDEQRTIRVKYVPQGGVYRIKAKYSTGNTFPIYENGNALMASNDANKSDNSTLFVIDATGAIQDGADEPIYNLLTAQTMKTLNWNIGLDGANNNPALVLILSNHSDNISWANNGMPNTSEYFIAANNAGSHIAYVAAFRKELAASRYSSGSDYTNIQYVKSAENGFSDAANIEYVSTHKIYRVRVADASGTITCPNSVTNTDARKMFVFDHTPTTADFQVNGVTPTEIDIVPNGDGYSYNVTLYMTSVVDWTLKIVGGQSSDRVLLNNNEYANEQSIKIAAIHSADVKTNVTDRFVWGPIIDEEQHTVTFEIRDVSTALTAGHWYQMEIIPGYSGVLGGSSKTDLTSAINSNISGLGHKSNYIYLNNATNPSNRSDYLSIMNFEGYTGSTLQSYIYVCDVNSSNNAPVIQHINGMYVDNTGKQTANRPAASSMTSVVSKQNDNSFIWSRWQPWLLNNNDISPYLALGSNSTNTMWVFFHEVKTGEDYDIYKIEGNDAVEYTGSATCNIIVNSGGTYIFLPKGTSINESDFRIGGKIPLNISTQLSSDGTVNELSSTTFNFEEPHYFYNEEHDVFLGRGGNWGTQSVNDNIGLPYKITSKTITTLEPLDWDGSGLGTNLFTDNGAPCTWTFSGDDTNGYTIYNNDAGGYIMAGDAHSSTTAQTEASLASRWKILDREEYAAVMARKQEASLKRVSVAGGLLNIDELNTSAFNVLDKTSAVTNASLNGNISGWTQKSNNSCTISPETNSNGTELFQENNNRDVGSLSQVVTNLTPGIYKVEIQGFYRDGYKVGDCSFADAGYPISFMYLAANGYEARFKSKCEEEGANVDYPDNMTQYKAMADAGKYKVELYTFVGQDGRLELSINVPNYRPNGWAIFSNLKLTYYEQKTIIAHSDANFVNMTGHYTLAADFNATASIGTAENPFTGTVDGQFNVIRGLTHALFGVVRDATIKNIILEDVRIGNDGMDYSGAIANQTYGSTTIYNCGVLSSNLANLNNEEREALRDKPFTSNSTISNNYAGGIVGQMREKTRIVNCFSYADVDGGMAGGIVGDYVGTWYDGSAPTNKLMVANCMVYGNVKGGSNGGRSPIVNGGTVIKDDYSKYSYFRYKSISDMSGIKQNGALAIQEDIWLDRFKFFQAGVTNHRDIAAYYIFGDASMKDEMAQWYIDEAIAPWPILRKADRQKSILNRAIPNTGNANEGNLITDVPEDVKGRYNMNLGNGSGQLSVTINITGTGVASGAINSRTITLPITDMDDRHYDYTWGKVVLPFANEFDGWVPDYDYICTGWEIRSVTGGTAGALTDYNFADRNCTAKDIYNATNNPIIFAQGGNYVVPYGVTGITINAHFAKAYYLADEYYDLNATGGITHAGKRPTTYHGKTVYNRLKTSSILGIISGAKGAWSQMSDKALPHDQALVLVGNFHYNENSADFAQKACTIISVDEDGDQQPDYGWYSSVGTARPTWAPVRWDFVPIVGSGMLQMSNIFLPGLSIPASKGWFELSETALCRTYEFEVNDASMASSDNGRGNNPYIIKGGWFQQLVRCYYSGSHNKLSYFNIGGNAYIKEFFHGNHSSQDRSYSLVPVVVTGGEVESCFMTGQKLGNHILTGYGTKGDAHFYCSGGKIGKYLSAYMEYPVINAVMKVDHARIGRFFGGGTTPKAQLQGNIDITMNYSDVDFFCGGPEFGDMAAGKTVTVNTMGSTYGEYYGAGFGGTALTRLRNAETIGNNYQMSEIDNYESIRLGYNANNGGVGVSYEMECLLSSSGDKLFRFYDYYAALSMAQTGDVTTMASDCLFKKNFYGGGCQGRVSGNTTSILTDCIVLGDAFAGGYKAAATEINVYPTNGGTYPSWDNTYKAYTSYGTYPVAEKYTWVSGTDGEVKGTTIGTSVDMTHMGEVTGSTSLSIRGSKSDIKGDVYGGGQESKVLKDAQLSIENGIIGKDIFGGGQGVLNADGTVKVSADINGTTTVNISGGKFNVLQIGEGEEAGKLVNNNNVYGGGNLACIVAGNTNVNVNAGMLPQSFFQSVGQGNSQFADWCVFLSKQQNKPIQAGFLGAGYGKNTQVLGNTDLRVNVGMAIDVPTQEDIVKQYNICMTSAGTENDNPANLAARFVGNLLGGGYDGTVQQNTNVRVEGNPYIANIYGGGLGSLAGAASDYNSEVGSVYGGTKVDLNGGIVLTNIYGGGAGIFGQVPVQTQFGNGNMPFFRAGMVHRDAEVNINGNGTIVFGDVFGGGDIANTGWYNAENRPKAELRNYHNANDKLMDFTTSVNLYGGNVMGNVFGGGNGRNKTELDMPEMIGAVIGNVSVRLGSPIAEDGSGSMVWGSLYGGGQTGQVFSCSQMARNNGSQNSARDVSGREDGCTNLEIFGGGVGHDLFGGGLGYIHPSDASKNTSADIGGSVYAYFGKSKLSWEKYWRVWMDEKFAMHGEFADVSCSGTNKNTESDLCHNFYGGGNKACKVKGDVTLLMVGAPTPDNIDNLRNSQFFKDALGIVGMPHFAALGGGFGKNAVVEGDVNLNLHLEAGNSFVYAIGGGMNGPVNGTCHVNVNNDPNSAVYYVYGGGYYAPIHKGTKLDITSGTIMKNVFGGGVMGDIGVNSSDGSGQIPNDNATSIIMNIGGETINILGSVYGGNDVSGTVEGLIKMNITGGTIAGNLFGAGNGDHIGYYVPGSGLYDMGENNNYNLVSHEGVSNLDGIVYKSRPQTPVGVDMSFAGISNEKRVKVLGQVFGGGNSCTIGTWNNDGTFAGGGKLNINIGSHVTFGSTNASVADAYKMDGENVSGLFIGCSGENLATQNTAKANNYYHHYYDKATKAYWPGFPVYNGDGTSLLTRDEGILYFNRYMENILLKTDNINLTFANNAEDVWMANFVGGGFCGSMKGVTTDSKFVWSLPAGVTVGNCVIGGAFNTDVVYRIFNTSDGHTYTENNGEYEFLTDASALVQGTDFERIEYAPDGTTVKGIVRFNYNGGILSNDGYNKDDIVQLNLYNQFDGGEASRVFGGCFASGTVQGDTKIEYYANGAYDIYGGGALADVAGSTKVNLFGGSLVNAYGGGLGRVADATHTAVAALVKGNATVTLNGAKVSGSIFGCNNVNGTPLGHAKVHVLSTVARDGAAATAYHVPAVYGGGNRAAYMPTEVDPGHPTAFAEVLIENCNNSIEYVYGGGNAAPVPATQVTVYGADAIDNVFAGGNGAGEGNPGADIGYLDYYSQKETGAIEYGMGTTVANIYGGTIHKVYGGSNTLGYIRTKATVNVEENASPTQGVPQCDLNVGEIFVAGNEADMFCDGILNIGCLEQDLNEVYGGANNANLKGNITLNITNGTIKRVFGGNNKGGNIDGAITVNIDETGCKPVCIGALYCGGNQAAYSVYGYTAKDTPRDKDAFNALTEEQKIAAGFVDGKPYADPVINVISFTSIDSIFGGGLGADAKVYGNTNININPIVGKFAAMMTNNEKYGITHVYDAVDTEEKMYVGTNVGLIGNIYGGGSEAVVYGNTNVNIGTKTNASHVTGSDVLKMRNFPVTVNITGNVYGGGKKAVVTGDTNVQIGREN